MVSLAVILLFATLVEKQSGLENAKALVYHSPWFIALLTLLSANVLAAVLVRYPWQFKHWGFLLAHAGLLAVLAGSIITFTYGIEGSITFKEGEIAREILLPDVSRFTAAWQNPPGGQANMASVFAFRPGPLDWPSGKTLDLGSLGGVHLKILSYYPRAQVQDTWQPDPAKNGGPALEFVLLGHEGLSSNRSWLASGPFGGRLDYGPLVLELYRAGADSLAEDFLNPPPPDGMDKDGVLSIHYQAQTQRVPVSENVGKRIPLGSSGASVEIAEYLPNAQPTAGGQFTSAGNEPLNPFLELRVHLPGAETPLRQIAFARHPQLTLDAMHGRDCPVKFWYHHKSLSAQTGASFLQTPDGKLYYRVGKEGKYQAKGEAHANDEIALTGPFKLRILQYLPSAQRKLEFVPADPSADESSSAEAAAQVQVDVDDLSQIVWLCRNHPEYGRRQIDTPQGPLMLAFGYDYVPLEFSLKLIRFTHGLNPGQMGDASYASTVRLVDQAAGINEEREISMNHPLDQGKYVFYQMSFQTLADGTKVSALSVAYDPGRTLKHIGCILLCIGAFMAFYLRSPRAKPSHAGAAPDVNHKPDS
jgi:hypothetical protein